MIIEQRGREDSSDSRARPGDESTGVHHPKWEPNGLSGEADSSKPL